MDCLSLLALANINLDVKDDSGQTPLQVACLNKNKGKRTGSILLSMKSNMPKESQCNNVNSGIFRIDKTSIYLDDKYTRKYFLQLLLHRNTKADAIMPYGVQIHKSSLKIDS